MEEEEESDNSSTKFAQSIVEQVNRSDIEAMVQVQRDMYDISVFLPKINKSVYKLYK